MPIDFTPQIEFQPDGGPAQGANSNALNDHFDKTISAAVADNKTPDGEAKPFTFGDALQAGWQQSIQGLEDRKKMPDKVLPGDAAWYQRIASQAATMAGDAPTMVEGFGIGMAGGAELGPGALVTGTGGAFGLPAGLRRIMMDSYQKGEISTPGEFLERASGALIDTAKGYITGAATALSGGWAGTAAKAASPLVQAAASNAAQLATMTTVSKALEGHLPHWQDFIDNATLLFGLKSAEFGAGKLADVYTKTGVTPTQVSIDASKDPTIHQDMASGLPVPRAYQDSIDPMFKPKEETVASVPAKIAEPVSPEDQAAANIFAKIQVNGEAADKAPYSFKKFYADWVDNLDPIKRVQDDMQKTMLKNPDTLPAAEDPYKLFRVSRGGYERANQFIQYGTVGFKDYKPNGESLTDVLAPVKDDLNGFRTYIVARRALELHDRGIESGFTDADAKTVVGDPANARFEDAAKRLTDYNNRVSMYARDAGLIDKATYKHFTDLNKLYVPYDRVFPDAEIGGSGAAGVQTASPFSNIKGSSRDIIDPLETTVKNTYSILTLAERANASNQLLKLASKSGFVGDGKLFEKVPTRIEAINVTNEELSAHIRKGGQNETTIGTGNTLPAANGDLGPEGTKVTFNPENLGNLPVFRAMRQPLADDEIAIYRHGEREVYKINNNPELVTAFKGMPSSMNDPMFKFVSSFTRVFRAGTILNPDFLPRHMVRQNINAYMNSPTGMMPIYSALKGAADMLNPASEELLQQWRSGGGMNSEITAWDRRYIQNSIDKLENGEGLAAYIDRTKNDPMSLAKLPYNAAQSAIDLAHTAIATHDNYLRFAQFKASMEDLQKQGVTGKDAIIEAAYQGREVLLDNFRRGARMQAVNQIWAFSNLRMQGLDKMARLAAGDPTQLALRAGSIATVSMLLWWANHDDPRYKEAQDWQRDNFWLIPHDDWRLPQQGDTLPDMEGMSRKRADGETEYNFGNMYRVSKPQESGLLFGSSIERFLDFAQTKDPSTAMALGKSFKDALIPEVVPSMAMPVYEAWANKSMFTGGPLVPASAEPLLPAYQQTAYTSELAKSMGQMIGSLPGMSDSVVASPPIIENFVRQWTGGLGMYTLQLADKGLREAGVLPDPTKPATTLADIPFVRAFVVRFPSASTKSITDFYDQYDHESKVYATIESLAKSGKTEASMALAQTDPMAQGKLDGVRQALSAQQKFIQQINETPTYTSDEKRQLIDSAYYQMINTAQFGNTIMRQMAADLKGQQPPQRGVITP